MMSMSDTPIPKEQQTAYQRWEMSAFTEDDAGSRSFNPKKAKSASAASTGISSALESVRKEAYTKGMQEGFSVGMAKAKEYAAKDHAQFLSIASAFENALEMADQKVEEDILGLALDIAKLMLKTKIEADPEVILPVVRDAIHYLPNVQKPARIIVHHEDARILRDQLAEELSDKVWQIQEDSSMERGGCLVETGENQIDATNSMRWKRISEALAKSNDWLLP
jgi:flagellar assembly protein FliH